MDRFIPFNPEYESDAFFADMPTERCDACNSMMRYSGEKFEDEDSFIYYPSECHNEICPESPYFDEQEAAS